MEQAKVLTAWANPFGMRVLIGLEEKGVKYEYQEEQLCKKSDLLLQMNPVNKKVPVLIHNAHPINDSLVILQYIEEAWDSKQFMPSKPYDRALARFWADFVDKKFYDSMLRLWKSKEEAQEQSKLDLLESFRLLEGALKDMSAGGSLNYFGGEEFGFLDIAVIPFVCWFHIYEIIGNFKIPIETEYPLLHAWVKRCKERDSVKKIIPPSDRILEFVNVMRKKFVVD